MSGTLFRTAGAITMLTVTLALPAVAHGSGDPNKTPTTEPCTGAGCQPAQGPATAEPTSTTAPQRENVDQAGYALCGLLAVLLVSIPIAVTWQRGVRQKATASVDHNADGVPRLTRI